MSIEYQWTRVNFSVLHCLTNAQYDQHILSVCIYDSNAIAMITSFNDVTLDNGQISTLVINSNGKPTSFASVSNLH